jgi:predicted metalloenzyme YecM
MMKLEDALNQVPGALIVYGDEAQARYPSATFSHACIRSNTRQQFQSFMREISTSGLGSRCTTFKDSKPIIWFKLKTPYIQGGLIYQMAEFPYPETEVQYPTGIQSLVFRLPGIINAIKERPHAIIDLHHLIFRYQPRSAEEILQLTAA